MDITTLPLDVVRVVVRYVGELKVGDGWADAVDLMLFERKPVCVPRQLYVVTRWHTEMFMAKHLYRHRDVHRVANVLRHAYTDEAVAVHCAPSLRHRFPPAMLPLYVAPDGYVPKLSANVVAVRRGSLEPFHHRIDAVPCRTMTLASRAVHL